MDAQELRNLREAYMKVCDEAYDPKGQDKLVKKMSSLAEPDSNSTVKQNQKRRERSDKMYSKHYTSYVRPKSMPGGIGGPEWKSRKNKEKANEQVDIYDIILSHLLDEGYAETPEAAEVIMVNMSEEQLDEISQKLATKAYAERRTGEFEGDDSPERIAKTDKLEKRIAKKFGPKAAAHADEAAAVKTFGRKDASGRRKQTPQPRIQKSDYRTTQDGKMHKQDQKELKTELRIKRDRRLRAARAADTNEQVDIYDIILSHLLDEGYAETVEAAEVIMVNMSEEWRESIVEAVSGGSYYDLPGVVIRAASGAASKLLNRGQPPAAKPKPHPSDSKLVDVSTADKAAKNLPGSRVYNQRQQQQSR